MSAAVEALQALAHEHRLRLFRILVRWGALGLSAGDIAEALGVAPSSLSFHLGKLERAGLIRSRRAGRRTTYAVSVERMQGLLAYLAADCCHGHPELCVTFDGVGGEPSMGRDDPHYNVLFLCTGNSARSIMAECILNRAGMGRFTAYSAGSHPKGEVHPFALALLRNTHHDVSGLRSKDWSQFAAPGAPALDFVFTVCDRAASEACPVWPGTPVTAHWGVPDPAAATGSDAEIAAAFADAYRRLHDRISVFASLPIDALDRMSIQKRLDAIGARDDAAAATSAASP